MSLRVMHIVFVVCATALAVVFGVWCLSAAGAEGMPSAIGGAAASFGAAMGLCVYGVRVWRKLQGLSR